MRQSHRHFCFEGTNEKAATGCGLTAFLAGLNIQRRHPLSGGLIIRTTMAIATVRSSKHEKAVP
jgi:hypothetical protein